MNGMTRGKLAQMSGVNPETVRYYEHYGLLPIPARSPGGYRLYTQEDVQRVRFIKRAQAVGFALDEIGVLLGIKADPNGTSGEVRAIVVDKVADIDAKIRALQAMKHTLMQLIDDCPGGSAPVDSCPILASFDQDETASAFWLPSSSV